MRWIRPALFTLALILAARAPQAGAESPSPPCSPPPGTANLIACYGNTPCPFGYLDPVGLVARNIRQNPANPNGTPWLCIQDPSTQTATGATSQTTAATSAAPPPAAAAAPPPLVASAPVITTTLGLNTSTALGPFLTDNQGMTLYIRTTDTAGTSTCNNACAIIWLPLPPPSGNASLPDGAAGSVATLTRTDGTQQLSYNGMPLYRYTGDFQPGDANGQNLDATTAQGAAGTWKVATP